MHVMHLMLNLKLDLLMLDIETDGTVSPVEALQPGAQFLRDQLNPFASLTEGSHEVPSAGNRTDPEHEHRLATLMRPIDELDLSVRSSNGLKAEDLYLVGDFIQRTETELLRTPNLGRRSLGEIKEALEARGLTLGTAVWGWPLAGGGRTH